MIRKLYIRFFSTDFDMECFLNSEWMEQYSSRGIKPEDLSKIIKPGSNIFIGSACSEPQIFTRYIAEHRDDFIDCRLYHFFSLSDHLFTGDSDKAILRHNTLAIIGNKVMRESINQGYSDFTPVKTSDIPEMVIGDRRKIKINYALIQVSPPDKHGYSSLGINVDITRTITMHSEKIIAVVNPRVPRTAGDSLIKFDKIDYFYYTAENLIEYRPDPITQEIEKACSFVARLIDSSSTVNLGIGNIPYYLPNYLMNKRDLAVFSEVIQESIQGLIEKGVITGSSNYYSRVMTTFALGTKAFYEFLDNNFFVEFHSSDFITDPMNIARNHKLCSIYSALYVDLYGQATNHRGAELYSGEGGEADFIRGTQLSKGGKSIITMLSTDKEGNSRILPVLPSGPISLRWFDIHYVVTEFGIANLYGKPLRKRAIQLIGIAHPKHRNWLLEEAKKMKLIYEDQELPTNKDGIVVIYPDYEWVFEYDTYKITLRAITPADERLIQEFYYSLSEKDKTFRFFTPKRTFSHEELHGMLKSIDYQNNLFLIGLIGEGTSERIIASAGYFSASNTTMAELSIAIESNFRSKGLGLWIVEKLIDLAQERGFKGFYGDIMTENKGMLKLLYKLPYRVEFENFGDTMQFSIRFNEKKTEKGFSAEPSFQEDPYMKFKNPME